MITRTSIVALLPRFAFVVVLASLAPLADLRAQNEEGTLKTRVENAVEHMRDASLSEVIQAAGTLRNNEDAVPMLREMLAKESEPKVRIGLLRALTDNDAEKDAVEPLLDLAGADQTPEIRIAALEILRDVPSTPDLERKLGDALDRTYEPDVKVALALALYELSEGASRKHAQAELKAMLKSEDRSLRIKGALALGEIEDYDSAHAVLTEIKEEPTQDGRLARQILKNEETQHFFENREMRLIQEGATKGSGSGDESFALLREIMNAIQSEHIYGEQYTGPEGEEKLLSAAAKGMLELLDKHSTYFSQEEYEKWLLDLNREYAGIGAYVNTINNVFTITRPIYSGPAYEVGLRSDDQIWAVDGKETLNVPQDKVIELLKGKPGTNVTVKIMRAGWKEPRDFQIARRVIHIDTVRWELFPGDIGYIEVETFGENTAKAELKNALNDLEKRGAKGLILDLRYNPGGYLNEAVEMCGDFLGPGKLVVETRSRHEEQGQGRSYITRKGAKAHEEPLIVLINHGSASASEIVSGTLKHYGRAMLVGDQSYGKGSVQNPFPIESRKPEAWDDKNRNGTWDPSEPFDDKNKNGKWDCGSMVKLTTQRYYLPNGESIHTDVDADGRIIKKGGVTPDVEVGFEGTAAWKQEELADLIEKDAFQNYVKERMAGHEQLFVELAEGDEFKTDKYPDFDAFYDSLNTHLDKNEIRKWLRLYMRDRVADLRKKPFPGNGLLGDFQEDNQLQRAIVEMCKKLSLDPAAVPQYTAFANVAAEQDKKAEEAKKQARK